MNKIDYNAKKPAIKGSDVEMKDASSIKQIVSTKQKQLDFLKQMRFQLQAAGSSIPM
jgi:hypothetical protein